MDEGSGPATVVTGADAGTGPTPADSGSGPQAPVGDDAGSIGSSPDTGSLVQVPDTGTGADTGNGAGEDAGVDASIPGDDAGSDGSVVSTIPATCAEAHQATGCCVGNVLYYCNSGPLSKKACTGAEVCGWRAGKSWYDCVAAPGVPDPSGANPMACK
jgi:hypothetical protein